MPHSRPITHVQFFPSVMCPLPFLKIGARGRAVGSWLRSATPLSLPSVRVSRVGQGVVGERWSSRKPLQGRMGIVGGLGVGGWGGAASSQSLLPA